jgi:hypothetical protein
MGQKFPKQLRLPAGENSHEHMGSIVPGKRFDGRRDRAPRQVNHESGFTDSLRELGRRIDHAFHPDRD